MRAGIRLLLNGIIFAVIIAEYDQLSKLFKKNTVSALFYLEFVTAERRGLEIVYSLQLEISVVLRLCSLRIASYDVAGGTRSEAENRVSEFTTPKGIN